MPGTMEFTYCNFGKEATRGTPVAPTRMWLGDTTGVLGEDLTKTTHEGERRGRRAKVWRISSQAEDASLKITGEPTFDDMVWPLTSVKGGMTGTGAGADKTWAAAPSMTAANNQEAFSVDAGDDVQNWRFQYVMWQRFKLTSQLGKSTRIEGDLFAQRAIKVAKATPAVPAFSPKILGDLWTLKQAGTFAGLAGASVLTTTVVDSACEFWTGLTWEHYQDGNPYGAQHVETEFDGKVTLTVESTAGVISGFYDKWKADTLDYLRWKNTSPVVLGGSFPSLQFDMAVYYTDVQKIADVRDGINLYKIAARMVDDGTNPLYSPTLVCSLASIP